MFTIKMAGLTIRINNRYQYVRWLCRKYITDAASPDITVSATEEEIRAQQGAGGSSPAYCESLCIYRNICLQLPAYDGFLIHGAAIAVDGQAYLFCAKSGVGKTTHMRLWMEAFGDRAKVINGDKPVLRRFYDRWVVCGTPWCGKENFGGNHMAPLKVICFIERSEENSIAPASAEQVTGRIFHQLLMPRDEQQMTDFFALLEDFLGKVPGYFLGCNQDPGAVQVAYEGMQHGKIDH